jgi:branched-chain amino acid transport system substrate-binding protein
VKRALASVGRARGRQVGARGPRPRLRIRWLAGLALLPALTGCGRVALSASNTNSGNELTIYASVPLQGPSAPQGLQIVNGEKLALWQAGAHVGPFSVGLVSLDDASIGSAHPEAGSIETATNAKTAAQDPSAIAYLGDYDSSATAVSLPLINAAGILQVSPASPYVGLTYAHAASADEPERFYPTGQRTFGRIMPADPVQARAQVQVMRLLHVSRVYLLNDGDRYQRPLSELVAEDARRAHIKVLGDEVVSTQENESQATSFPALVKRIVASGAQAISYAGGTGPGAVALWRELHAAAPGLALLASSAAYNSPSFSTAIARAGSETYITTPILPDRLYPPPAERVLAAYGARFGEQAQPYALYGYEAMSVVLAAIRSAGSDGNEREAVIKSFFATRDRSSVLGRYSIEPNGDTSLSTYAVDRVRAGKPVFWRALDASPAGL